MTTLKIPAGNTPLAATSRSDQGYSEKMPCDNKKNLNEKANYQTYTIFFTIPSPDLLFLFSIHTRFRQHPNLWEGRI